MTQLRIATRKSPLALWQARYVANRLAALHPSVRIELVELTTTGDRMLGAPLAAAGGKGLFMKELEASLIDRRADIAVHSMKDVVVTLPDEFRIAAICERDDPLDAFVSNRYPSLERLPDGARVGTCSLRRQAQIRHARPRLNVLNLRGNVNTRLRKLDEGEFDAIILAAAGLERLAMSERIRQRLAPEISLPAVGQGAVGVECMTGDSATCELVRGLDHLPSRRCVEAERAMNARLEGGCQVPVAGFARISGDGLWLEGLVGSSDGTNLIRASGEGAMDDPGALGEQVADELIALGARDILRDVYRAN